ncbi:hypothetical protein ACX1NX_01595 [Acinetobacter sp. ANC 5383]
MSTLPDILVDNATVWLDLNLTFKDLTGGMFKGYNLDKNGYNWKDDKYQVMNVSSIYGQGDILVFQQEVVQNKNIIVEFIEFDDNKKYGKFLILKTF